MAAVVLSGCEPHENWILSAPLLLAMVTLAHPHFATWSLYSDSTREADWLRHGGVLPVLEKVAHADSVLYCPDFPCALLVLSLIHI